ncbi:hypothetical protein MASR2M66_26110 [Chloroflexota bacterium]
MGAAHGVTADKVALPSITTLPFTPGYLEQVNPNATPSPTLTPSPSPTGEGSTPTPQSGWVIRDFDYDETRPHAVAAVRENEAPAASYIYDANGNMTCRTDGGVTYLQSYNTENRISSIVRLASGTCETPGDYQTQWDFAYDGDGTRVSTMTTAYENGLPGGSSLTSYYFGGAYESHSDGTTIKYYAFAGQMVAMNDGSGLQYFLTDHLGSVVAVTDASGTLISQQRYLPFGGERTNVGSISQTDYGYTGQRDLDSGMGGLMDYKARFYSPYLNHMTQPDSIVPNPYNSQDYDRYAYARNNPLRYTDPTGHEPGDCYNRGYCTKNQALLLKPPSTVKGEEITPYIKAVAEKYDLEIPSTYKWDYWGEEFPAEYVDDYAVTTYVQSKEYQGQDMNDHTIYLGSDAFSTLDMKEFAAVLAHEARHAWQFFLLENPSQDKYGAMKNMPPDVIDFSMNMTYQSMLLEADAYAAESYFLQSQFGVSSTEHLGNPLDISHTYETLLEAKTLNSYSVLLAFCEPFCK